MGSEIPQRRDHRMPEVRNSLPASLRQVLRWLDVRLDEPINLDTLAGVAGVRPRTL